MAIILNIDTAVETASLCLSKDGTSLQIEINAVQRDHSAWLHGAIRKMITDTGITLKDVNAVAVSIGPGSYTGLRVGLSAAKGLCMALKIPLISVSTLEMMAKATQSEATDLNCPMIDARRMEVFTAVFDSSGKEISAPAAMIIDQDSFGTLLATHKMLFSGNGSNKLKELINHPNALFTETKATAEDMISLSEQSFDNQILADLAYTEPLYLKEFYNPPGADRR